MKDDPVRRISLSLALAAASLAGLADPEPAVAQVLWQFDTGG